MIVNVGLLISPEVTGCRVAAVEVVTVSVVH